MDFDFKLGTSVFARKEEIGRLKYLVIDPQEEVITSLIVAHGQFFRKDLVVPVGWVAQADEKRIVLNASVRELEALPEYHEVEFRSPDPSARPIAGHPLAELVVWAGPYPGVLQAERPWVLHRGRLGVNEDEVLLKRGQSVYDREGYRVATLDHALVDDKTHRIKHLIVHQGQWLQRGEDLVVPAESVSNVTDSGVHLRLSREEMDKLARYRPPMDDILLEKTIGRSMQTQPETKGQDLIVQVERGLVRLFGEVSEAVASAAISLASKIQGVTGIEDYTTRTKTTTSNNLAGATSTNDRAIATQINDAFQRQRQADLSNVRVQVNQGAAQLTGSTRNIAGKALAQRAAQVVTGVRSVATDKLHADTSVRARVEAALADDPRTALVPIEVLCLGGVITLQGQVPSVEVKEAAEQIARAAAGVKAVVSELEVCPPQEEDENESLILRPAWLPTTS